MNRRTTLMLTRMTLLGLAFAASPQVALAGETLTAIATLGSSSAGTPVPEAGTNGTYRFTVKFAVPFPTVPIVVATPLQGTNFPQTIADTFAITVTAVTTQEFTVSVNRVDDLHGGWGQDLRLQYTASTF
jgi:H-type lectin domain